MAEGKKGQEIDLIELLLMGVTALRENFWKILLFFLVGALLGFGYFLSQRKVYESRMIISSNILTTSYAQVLFGNVNEAMGEGDSKRLSQQFGIADSVIGKIVQLRIENLGPKDDPEFKESDRYLITAEVYDPGILKELEKGIITYLEKNDFVKVRVEQNKAFFQRMLASVDREIADMQKFKVKVYEGNFFESTRGNVMFDPTTVNSKIVELTEKKLNYENQLALSNSVQLIEGFTEFKRHKRPKIEVSIVSGAFIGLLAVSALIVFKSINKLLKLAEAQKSKDAAA